VPTSRDHWRDTIRYRLLLLGVVTVMLGVGAGGLMLAERDNQATQGRVAARYTLCLEIRKLKVTLTDFMQNHREIEGADQLLRDLMPPTPDDCIRFAHLDDDQLVQVPDGG
jgi:hypothetical protein